MAIAISPSTGSIVTTAHTVEKLETGGGRTAFSKMDGLFEMATKATLLQQQD
jgi:hypothetical protein